MDTKKDKNLNFIYITKGRIYITDKDARVLCYIPKSLAKEILLLSPDYDNTIYVAILVEKNVANLLSPLSKEYKEVSKKAFLEDVVEDVIQKAVNFLVGAGDEDKKEED